MGVCLEPSRLVSLDLDSPADARRVLAAEGVDVDELIATTPTIEGRAPRCEFRAPTGVVLSRKKLVWPPRENESEGVTVFELRAGRCQDVLPPSIHPKTGKPYRWVTPPRDGSFPPLPDRLLALWLDFDAFVTRHRAPWAKPEPVSLPRVARTSPYAGVSVIAAFNDAHDSAALLESHGYVRAGKHRWKSPNGHNLAGVVQLPSGKIFCHHASDPLGDERAHDSFDLYAVLDHGGDVRRATRAAAELLGMRQRRSA